MKDTSERINMRLLVNVLFLTLSFLILLNLFLITSIAETLNNAPKPFVTLRYLVDPTCANCYNVSVHSAILAGKFGIQIQAERVIDFRSPEGQDLIDKYNIEGIPTVLIGESVVNYRGFSQAFLEVGTQEEDGIFVFRKLDYFGEGNFREI